MPYGVVSQGSYGGYKRKFGNVNRAPSAYASQLSRQMYGARSAPKVPVVTMLAQRRFKKRSYGQGGAEIKYLDTAVNTTANVTASVTSINTIAQGLTNILRIGNKIQIKSVAMRMSAYPFDPAVAIASNNHKWTLVLDKEPEAAAIATYNQIFTANSIQAFRNVGESDRFVVLAQGMWSHGDRRITAGSVYSDGGEIAKVWDKFLNINIATKYVLTTATQTAFGTNQLLFCVVSEQTDGNYAMDVNCRIRFTDE